MTELTENHENSTPIVILTTTNGWGKNNET